MISRGKVVASDTMDNLLEGSGDCAVIKVETDGDEEKIKQILSSPQAQQLIQKLKGK